MSSVGARVFCGCRALLAPAKSASPTTLATAVKEMPKAKAKPKEKSSSTSPPRLNPISRPIPISPALGKFLEAPEASRAEAVKKIWAYIKSHDLQNPTNKKEILCDEKLKTIFEGKDKVGFLEIAKLLSVHFVKTA